MKKYLFFIFLSFCILLLGCKEDLYKKEYPKPPQGASLKASFTFADVNNTKFRIGRNNEPVTVRFTNTSFNDAGSTYYWIFPDSTVKTNNGSLAVTYTFKSPGRYTVKLIVESARVVASTEQVVNILPAQQFGQPLYFTDGSTRISVVYLNNNAPIKEEIPLTFSTIRGLVADTTASKQTLYVSDNGEGKIYKVVIDEVGEVTRTVVAENLSSPLGLALDYREKKLYWCNGTTIFRVDLTKPMPITPEVYSTGYTDIRRLAIDDATGKIYTNEYGAVPPTGIWSVTRTSGTRTAEIPATGGGIGIAVGAGRLFYHDFSGTGNHRIRAVSLSNLTGPSIDYGDVGANDIQDIVYSAVTNKIYWGDIGPSAANPSDTGGRQIYRANPDGTNIEPNWIPNIVVRNLALGKVVQPQP
ncbi:MAG: PKD domain-containing protein [Cytophagales bacterium]|nr:PKD domain-containing protein [Cytophagales bacterium]MDW8384268.1 PKD domain-containing protein [Flammeovirgaceae bacterium]